jgi:hypothetical protein
MTSKRQRILEALADRLREIQATNGFETDAGLHLYWGPVVLGPDDEPLAIAIVPGGTETNPQQAGKKIIMMPVQLHAVVREETPQPNTLENTWLQAEAILGDIKRAVELDDLTLGKLAVDIAAGEVVPLLREEGGSMLGLQIEYRIIYTEHWGDPSK